MWTLSQCCSQRKEGLKFVAKSMSCCSGPSRTLGPSLQKNMSIISTELDCVMNATFIITVFVADELLSIHGNAEKTFFGYNC